MKKALAILGDSWHAPNTVKKIISEKLQLLNYSTDIVTDYTKPSAYDIDFKLHWKKYDLVVLSKYGLNDYKSYMDKQQKQRIYWLSDEAQKSLEEYVLNGGKIFFHHAAIGFYPKESPICRLARGYCINHPSIITIQVFPLENNFNINKGISTYNIADEEFNMEIDKHNTYIFLESFTKENGYHPQGWCHGYGKGKVAVFVPGHDNTVQQHPFVRKGIENVIRWLSD